MATGRLDRRGQLQALAPELATGLRAATATVVPFALAGLHGRPELAWMAVGGWLGTLADPGGSRAARARQLAAFTGFGAALVVLGGAGAAWGLPPAVFLAAAAFVATMLRALGASATSLGTMLAIVAALSSASHATDRNLSALWFGAGGTLALVLSSIVWPVWTHWPVRRAIGKVLDALSGYLTAIDRCAAHPESAADADGVRWIELAREHHRRVRDAIEDARAMALAIHARRASDTRLGANLRVLLGMLESQFLTAVTLAGALEALPWDDRGSARAVLSACAARYDALRAILVARAVTTRPVTAVHPGVSPADAPRAADTSLRLAAILEDESQEALVLASALDRAEPAALAYANPNAKKRSVAVELDAHVLRDALSPNSPIFRHAVRVATAVALAAWLGARVSPNHTGWVTVTTLVVLQPFAGATVRRATERMLGTVVGGVLAIGVTSVTVSPLALGAIMFPLSVAAVVTRRRSYSLFTFFLTPIFVLVATIHPGDWWTAVARAGDTVLGGMIALGASLVVFPGFEERRGLPEALAVMVANVQAYAESVLRALDTGDERAAHAPTLARRSHEARRAAATSISEAESALERALAEPGHLEAGAERATELVTLARRLALTMTGLETLDRKGLLGEDARPTMVARARRLAALMRDKAMT